jgi:hypothetical protein
MSESKLTVLSRVLPANGWDGHACVGLQHLKIQLPNQFYLQFPPNNS